MEAARPKEELQSVLVLKPLKPLVDEGLSKKFHLVKPWEFPMPKELFFSTHAQSVRVLISTGLAPVDAQIIDALPALGCVLTTSAGVEHVDLAACRQRGIVVANSGKAYSEDVADYTVGLLLDVLRCISASDRFVRAGLWPINGDYHLGTKLSGKRVGIVGLGNIGSEIAKRLDAFGCKIAYNSRRKKSSVPFPYFSSVRELASESDILILCCAFTDETYHVVDRDVLLALGKKGVIINVGRGVLVDEKELVKLLVEGEIGGAGLDVFENEPQVPQELISMDNVVLSPHTAVMTPESWLSLLQLLVSNLEAFFSNRPLLNPL